MSEIFNLGDLPAAWHRGNAAKRKRLQAWNFNWRFEPESRSVKTDSTGGRALPGLSKAVGHKKQVPRLCAARSVWFMKD